MRLQRFKPGELQQICDIKCRKPVLLRAWDLHSDPFRKCDEWFPKMIVSAIINTRVCLRQSGFKLRSA